MFQTDISFCLCQIISRYDIILILEVVDITGTSVETLMQALNKLVKGFKLIQWLHKKYF